MVSVCETGTVKIFLILLDLFSLNFYFLLIITPPPACMCECMCIYAWVVREQLSKAGFLVQLLCGFWVLNSGHQACSASILTCCTMLLVLFVIFKFIPRLTLKFPLTYSPPTIKILTAEWSTHNHWSTSRYTSLSPQSIINALCIRARFWSAHWRF